MRWRGNVAKEARLLGTAARTNWAPAPRRSPGQPVMDTCRSRGARYTRHPDPRLPDQHSCWGFHRTARPQGRRPVCSGKVPGLRFRERVGQLPRRLIPLSAMDSQRRYDRRVAVCCGASSSGAVPDLIRRVTDLGESATGSFTLTGIERANTRSGWVQLGLSLCKHVQLVRRQPPTGRYECPTCYSGATLQHQKVST